MNSSRQAIACLLTFVLTLVAANTAHCDLIESGTFLGTSDSTGSFVAGATTFNLTDADIDLINFVVNFDEIDDGVEVRVNGNSLFVSLDTSQFGNQDFVVTGVQPNDIFDPWTVNENGISRLTVVSDVNGSTFSGSVTPDATTAVEYLPNFDVADFADLLVVGENTIEFVSHNGFLGADLEGSFTISTIDVVPVPSPVNSFLLVVLGGVAALKRSRK